VEDRLGAKEEKSRSTRRAQRIVHKWQLQRWVLRTRMPQFLHVSFFKTECATFHRTMIFQLLHVSCKWCVLHFFTSYLACVVHTEPLASNVPPVELASANWYGGSNAASEEAFGIARPSPWNLVDSINSALPKQTTTPSPPQKVLAAQRHPRTWGDGYDSSTLNP